MKYRTCAILCWNANNKVQIQDHKLLLVPFVQINDLLYLISHTIPCLHIQSQQLSAEKISCTRKKMHKCINIDDSQKVF